MAGSLNRRDFLRLAGLLPLSAAAPSWARQLSAAAGGQQNVLIIVFDALSASHLSLYGYPRETMPNLTKLAKRAIVYHHHYAGSSFTTSGTASLLAGTLPWTNRALAAGGRIAESVVSQNVFEAFGDYYSQAYTHNGWAEILLKQFSRAIKEHIPAGDLYLGGRELSPLGLFSADDDVATVAWTRYMKIDEGHAYSLFLSDLQESARQKLLARYAPLFPGGMPSGAGRRPYILEDAVERFSTRLPQFRQPFLSYLHFLPPHDPYRPPKEFDERFRHDNLHLIQKPKDIFAAKNAPLDQSGKRIAYDEFLLYADKAFGALYHSLEMVGLLENTWLIFTSDHGEMFERGLLFHNTPALYEPIVHVPLLIFEPGRKERVDIHGLTSAVDVLPTLAHLTGHAIPSWVEGSILPPFTPPQTDRAVYALRARHNDPAAALTIASTMMAKGPYKLHYYFGYPALKAPELVRLFNVRQDPEEMEDLSSSDKGTTAALLDELKAKIAEVNRPYA